MVLKPLWQKAIQAEMNDPLAPAVSFPKINLAKWHEKYAGAMYNTAYRRFEKWMKESKGKRTGRPSGAESEEQGSRRGGTRRKM